jgi:hypothetical protein
MALLCRFIACRWRRVMDIGDGQGLYQCTRCKLLTMRVGR